MGDTGTLTTASGATIAVSDTQRKVGDLFVHLGKVDQGRSEGRRCGRDEGRWQAPHQPARAPLGDAPAARSAAPPARRARHAEGLAGRARPPALRLQPQQGDEPRGHRGGGARGQRPRPRQRGGRNPPDDAAGRDRGRRDGAVRREIRRRGARGLDGRQAGQREQDLLDRAVRRHPRAAHRRHRPVQDHQRRRGRRRRAPHRSGDRRGGGSLHRRAAARAERGGHGAEDAAERSHAAHRRAARRAQAPGARTDRDAQGGRRPAARAPVRRPSRSTASRSPRACSTTCRPRS